jgi:probable rRNA maturation factor
LSALVETVIEAEGWAEALPDLSEAAETAARLALEAEGRDPAAHEIALLATDDAGIARLNARFRGKDRPTNVLSFPAAAPPPPAPAPGAEPVFLGDLALALGTVTREAEAAGRPLKDHAIHLILHGCLHLLGHDHGTEGEAGRMEGIEIRALASLGIPDPYCRGDAAPPHPD